MIITHKIRQSFPSMHTAWTVQNLHDSVYGFMIPAIDETLGTWQRVSLQALPPLHSPQTHRRESQHPGEMGQTSEGKQYPHCAAEAVQSQSSLQ